MQRVLAASLQLAAGAPADLSSGRRPWTTQLAAEMAAVGIPTDLAKPPFTVCGEGAAAPRCLLTGTLPCLSLAA